MCDLLPETYSFCYCISLRVAVLLIAVMSIMMGSANLAIIESVADANLNQTVNFITMAAKANNFTYFHNNLNMIVLMVIAAISFMYIIAGSFLLIGDLYDENGFIQGFLWLAAPATIIAMLLLFVESYACVKTSPCLLNVDWISTAVSITFFFFLNVIWFYFIVVVNTYAMFGDSTPDK